MSGLTLSRDVLEQLLEQQQQQQQHLSLDTEPIAEVCQII